MSKKTTILILSTILIALTLFIAFIAFRENSSDKSRFNCETFGGVKYCASDYLGLTLEDAEELAEEEGLEVRVVSVDGSNNPLESNREQERINFTVENNVVVDAQLY